MTIMFDMDYIPYHIWVSLVNRKFGHAMAAYLMLQHQETQGIVRVLPIKHVHPEVGPCLPTADSTTFPLPTKRSATEPALNTFPFLLSGHQLAEKDQ